MIKRIIKKALKFLYSLMKMLFPGLAARLKEFYFLKDRVGVLEKRVSEMEVALQKAEGISFLLKMDRELKS